LFWKNKNGIIKYMLILTFLVRLFSLRTKKIGFYGGIGTGEISQAMSERNN